MRVPITVPKTIIPNEAHNIANQFRECAKNISDLSNQLKSSGATLDSNWEGLSKQHFFLEFSTLPKDIDNFSNWLNERANHIQNMKVIVWETEYIEV